MRRYLVVVYGSDFIAERAGELEARIRDFLGAPVCLIWGFDATPGVRIEVLEFVQDDE